VPYDELEFASQAKWEAWLDANHARADGVVIRFARKGSGIPTVTYAEALDVALCYGWIDGQSWKGDETHYRQRWTPRRKRSMWSKRNCARAEALIAAGAMHPAGLAEIERAKVDGRWAAAYDGQSTATVPDDLAAALDARPGARAFFDALNSQNRYAILHRVQEAKKPETRARRIAKFADMCAAGERIYS
jgi:uncharacterized protein YdeI (YjbR/CyaY-like superfamily)